MQPVLSVDGVRFERGSRLILDDINWQVRAGEHWVILGPNGCGKTSLINLLTGYDMATAGDIRVGDAQFGAADWREVRKRIGLVASTLTYYLESGEPVIDAVVSGREAMINLIGELEREAGEGGARVAAAVRLRASCGFALGCALAGRAAEDSDLPRADGKVSGADSR